MSKKKYFGFLMSGMFLLTMLHVASGEEFPVSDVTSFQTALTTAMSNGEDDVISVASGTYTLGATLTYTLTAESTENYSLTIEGAGPDETILDGDNGVQILNIDTQSFLDDSNAHFIVRNMTLQNGRNAGQAAGLSIWTYAADMTVENCVFSNNESTGSTPNDGGGAHLRSQSNGDITVKDCEFNGNSAYYGGGAWAISYWGTSEKVVQFINNSFINNSARYSYGGVYAHGWSGMVKLSGNLFVGNSCTYSGGGAWAMIYSSGSSPDAVVILTNNMFVDNTAGTYNGGGAYAEGGYGTTFVFNNTFVDNSATLNGGGLYVNVAYSYTVDAYIYNNIFWGNTATDGDDLYVEDNYNDAHQDGSQVDFYNNLYTELGIKEGNFLSLVDNISATDPLLDSEYHLTETSPCVDAGTNDVPDPPGLPSEDVDGEQRIMDGDENGSAIVDIGADEWFVAVDLCPNDPNKTDPGVCGCGVADTDTDSDGTPDCNDECPNDPDKIEPGVCGCGVVEDGTDTDNDNTPDCIDGCPNDPDKTEPGVCGCGVADTDTDNDNTPDCVDECPSDPDKTEPGVCGCGEPDIDSEPDGMIDCWEITYGLNPSLDDANEDFDEDGLNNIVEYNKGTNPKDPTSHPPRAMPWLPILLEED